MPPPAEPPTAPAGGPPLPEGSLDEVDADPSRGVVQPRCLQQWHGNVCGHHALFSASALVQGQPARLLDEGEFWRGLLDNVAALARHGERMKSWPPSRVTNGVVDEVQLMHLVNSDASLRGRLNFVPNVERLTGDLAARGSEARRALEAVRTGTKQAHGFLLVGAAHWYAAVAVAGSAGRAPTLLLCDSYNRPMARLRTEEDVAALVDAQMEAKREHVRQALRQHPDWTHRPEEHLDTAFEDGVPEYWKGTNKASLFWRFRPRSVSAEVLRQDFENMRRYVAALLAVLRPGSSGADMPNPTGAQHRALY